MIRLVGDEEGTPVVGKRKGGRGRKGRSGRGGRNGRGRRRRGGAEAELPQPHAAFGVAVGVHEGGEDVLGGGEPVVGIGCEEGDEGLEETREAPLRHGGLVAVGVAALPVDEAEKRRGVVLVQERAGAVVDGFAGDGDVVGVQHAVDEADAHPLGDEPRLRRHNFAGECAVPLGRVVDVGEARVVAADGVVRESLDDVIAAVHPRELERPDAQVARRDADDDRAGLRAGAHDRPAGGQHRQRPGGGDAQRVHRLTGDELAEHRAEGGMAVAAAGERGGAGTFQVDVAEVAGGVGDFAEQQRAPVAEDGDEMPELVARVRLRGGRRAGRQAAAHEERDAVGRAQPFRVDAELAGQRLVDRDEFGRGERLGLPFDGQLRQRVGEMRGQADGQVGGGGRLVRL